MNDLTCVTRHVIIIMMMKHAVSIKWRRRSPETLHLMQRIFPDVSTCQWLIVWENYRVILGVWLVTSLSDPLLVVRQALSEPSTIWLMNSRDNCFSQIDHLPNDDKIAYERWCLFCRHLVKHNIPLSLSPMVSEDPRSCRAKQDLEQGMNSPLACPTISLETKAH